MSKTISRKRTRKKRHIRLRRKLLGTSERPRLIVAKSLNNLSVQCIDDTEGKTVCSVSTIDKDFPGKSLKNKKNTEAMKQLAEHVLGKLKEKNVTTIRFDRNGYRYHGKVKLLVEKLRENGIKL